MYVAVAGQGLGVGAAAHYVATDFGYPYAQQAADIYNWHMKRVLYSIGKAARPEKLVVVTPSSPGWTVERLRILTQWLREETVDHLRDRIGPVDGIDGYLHFVSAAMECESPRPLRVLDVSDDEARRFSEVLDDE